MCSRFTLRRPRHPWLDNLPPALERPRYNIAPAQIVLAIGRDREGQRRVRGAIWGFRPRWLADKRREPVNARAETAATTPLFQQAFHRGRCLIPADGWYEWHERGAAAKQPHFFHRPDDALFWFASLATRDRENTTRITILTTEANTAASAIHARMPVVLTDDAAAAEWIDATASADTLTALLQPPANETIDIYPVSRRVNRPDNDDPRCIERDASTNDGH